MTDESSALFLDALHENSIEKMMKIPKSDLHNHVGRGGNIQRLSKLSGCNIVPPQAPFNSLDDMQKWFEDNIKVLYPGTEGYLKRVEASFVQAADDNIEVLSMSYGISEIASMGGMEQFIKMMDGFHMQFAPNTKFYPELAVYDSRDVEFELSRLKDILCFNWFKSIDWQGSELSREINLVKPLYKKAKEMGLKLRAHAGEFGNADYIKRCVEELELDEVHHGIAAVESKHVMKFLADNGIQLNLCPASNIMLKRANSYADYQIRHLYDYGIKVTINTDDLLIFNSSVSQEYLNLYNSKVLTDLELDAVRKIGLKGYEVKALH